MAEDPYVYMKLLTIILDYNGLHIMEIITHIKSIYGELIVAELSTLLDLSQIQANRKLNGIERYDWSNIMNQFANDPLLTSLIEPCNIQQATYIYKERLKDLGTLNSIFKPLLRAEKQAVKDLIPPELNELLLFMQKQRYSRLPEIARYLTGNLQRLEHALDLWQNTPDDIFRRQIQLQMLQWLKRNADFSQLTNQWLQIVNTVPENSDLELIILLLVIAPLLNPIREEIRALLMLNQVQTCLQSAQKDGQISNDMIHSMNELLPQRNQAHGLQQPNAAEHNRIELRF